MGSYFNIKQVLRPTIEFNLSFFIRNNYVRSIVKKVRNKNDEKMSDRALSQKPFGFRTNFIDFSESGEIKLYNKKAKSGIGFVKRDSVVKNASLIDKWKEKYYYN